MVIYPETQGSLFGWYNLEHTFKKLIVRNTTVKITVEE